MLCTGAGREGTRYREATRRMAASTAPTAPPALTAPTAVDRANAPASVTAPTAVDRAKALYVFSNEKGGMKGIDTEAINRIILETSGNSSYAAKQLKQDAKARASTPPPHHLLCPSASAPALLRRCRWTRACCRCGASSLRSTRARAGPRATRRSGGRTRSRAAAGWVACAWWSTSTCSTRRWAATPCARDCSPLC